MTSRPTRFTAYAVQYGLNLYSDFTYFLNQTTGDAIEQKDSRVYAGFNAEHVVYGQWLGLPTENTVGFQLRQDWVDTTLNNVEARKIVSHVRADKISELVVAPWYRNKM